MTYVIRVANRVRISRHADEAINDIPRGIIGSAAARICRAPDRFGEPDVVAALAECLTNPAPWIQFHAVWALDHLGPVASNAVPALKMRYGSGGRTVAQHAAHAVWRIVGERTEPLTVLLVSLTSSDLDVQNWTRRYLLELAPQTEARLPTTAALLAENPRGGSGPFSRRLPATCGLAGPTTCGFLRALTDDADSDLATAARTAIERVGCGPGGTEAGVP